ncbi:DUF4157 domain-containing protein [Marivirga sp. S37H4]|uniref:DUF4157 domain-containing protein n=1 Tax=Marivirga aurantiaca TaxID=2802615 RepID=A0A935C8R5_9BACT|nr:DUF4157 domain-containing protein [Marivirga aurantiaca]MBK6265122.1 DUF4157 domain-containing protein [Marivirga aurantiaca]
MNTHADKSQENKSQSVANSIAQKNSVSEPAFQFEDNRPEAVAQKKLREIVDKSPQAVKIAQLKAMAEIQSVQLKKEEEELVQKKENKTGLPDQLKTGIENLSGYSMDDVKVHRNSDKPAQLNAHAYAQGTDIHLASGQEKHLPHEAWHVVQQKQGRVKPTTQLKGKVNINDDAGLEKEADVMGERAIQLASASSFNKTPEKPLAFQTKSKGAIQLKRTEVGGALYTEKAFENPLELEETTTAAPRVVMSFGNNAQQLSELIMENKELAETKLNPKYVIGVNVGPTDIKTSKKGPQAPTMADAEGEAEKVFATGKDMGLVVIPFTWSAGNARDSMYEFPYFEARSLLMKAALPIGDLTEGTIYAMTDRDARDSTGIDPEHIAAERIDNQLNSKTPTLVAGPYDWREDDTDDALLQSIILVVNSAEEEFRNWKIQNGLSSYFPEPNLFFNRAGVETAIENFDGEKLSGQQAKESEVIRKQGINEKYNKHARVTKPAKKPIGKKMYLDGVYTLIGSFKKHKDVTAEDVQEMFDNIIQSELSASNVREMTNQQEDAEVKALEIIENAASIINKILKIK